MVSETKVFRFLVMRTKSNNMGFTLIELMIVLSIAAIILSLAVPSFSTFLKDSLLWSQVNELTLALHKARSEAVKRGTRVALCRSNDLSTPACGGTNFDWSTGWLIYTVTDLTAATPLYVSADDTLLGSGQAKTGITILADSDANQLIAFNADGTTTVGIEAEFAVCDSRGVSDGRVIKILPTGHPQTSDATDCSP